MKSRILLRLPGMMLACLVLWPVVAQAQEASNRLVFRTTGVYGTDEMDWEKKRIRVTAIGTYDPEEIAGEGDKMIMAQEQAELLAREKLVAMNYGVWVTGLSSLATRFTDQEARLITAGVLRNSQVEEVKFNQMNDGSVLAVVTMAAPLLKAKDLLKDPQEWQAVKTAVDQQLATIREEVGHRDEPEQPADAETVDVSSLQDRIQEATREDAASLAPPPPPAAVEGSFTGLIVDVRGIPTARVALLPMIIDETSRRIYGIEDVPSLATLNGELVQYASSMENAQRLPEAGKSPMVVRALRVDPYNPGHIVVSSGDGARILGADAQTQFLRRANVVLVFGGGR